MHTARLNAVPCLQPDAASIPRSHISAACYTICMPIKPAAICVTLQAGADMAGEALRGLDFTDEEKSVVQSAIFHHAYKELVHDVYDEILKDADVLQPFYSNSGTRVSALTKGRLEENAIELGYLA